jgi:hypothetical protein
LDQENVEANDLENDTHNQQDAEIGRGKNQYSKHVSNSFAGLSHGGYQREFKQQWPVPHYKPLNDGAVYLKACISYSTRMTWARLMSVERGHSSCNGSRTVDFAAKKGKHDQTRNL